MQLLAHTIVALDALSGSLAAPGLLGTIINDPNIIPAAFQNLGAALMETNAAKLADPLTMDQVATHATPSAADLTAVQNYLTSQGFTTDQMIFSAFKDQITVPTTVGQAAKLFAISFDTYSFGGV